MVNNFLLWFQFFCLKSRKPCSSQRPAGGWVQRQASLAGHTGRSKYETQRLAATLQYLPVYYLEIQWISLFFVAELPSGKFKYICVSDLCPILKLTYRGGRAPPTAPPHFSPSCRPTIRHCTMAPIQRCLPPRATIAPAPDQHAHINKAHWAITRPWQGPRMHFMDPCWRARRVTWPATGRQPLNIALLSFPRH